MQRRGAGLHFSSSTPKPGTIGAQEAELLGKILERSRTDFLRSFAHTLTGVDDDRSGAIVAADEVFRGLCSRRLKVGTTMGQGLETGTMRFYGQVQLPASGKPGAAGSSPAPAAASKRKESAAPVVIKQCRQLAVDEVLPLLLEARLLVALEHPNIVAVRAIAVGRHPVMVALERMDHGDLKS